MLPLHFFFFFKFQVTLVSLSMLQTQCEEIRLRGTFLLFKRIKGDFTEKSNILNGQWMRAKKHFSLTQLQTFVIFLPEMLCH